MSKLKFGLIQMGLKELVRCSQKNSWIKCPYPNASL